MGKTRHTREGPVERVILGLINEDRQRRGRRYGMRRHQTVSEGEINYALNLRGKRKRNANGGDWLTRSGAIATRAAMRRFAVKHPAFAVEVDAHGTMWLYDVKSRERDRAETAPVYVKPNPRGKPIPKAMRATADAIRAELKRRGKHMDVHVVVLGERDGVTPGIYTVSEPCQVKEAKRAFDEAVAALKKKRR